MLVAVAFCPAPPLLVSEVASGAAGELAGLRLACDEAVKVLLGAHADEVVVLGGGSCTREHPPDAAGSLAGFGVDVTTGGIGDLVLPLALTIGGWLLDRAPHRPARSLVEIAAGATSDEAGAVGTRLAARPGRTALLVLGDGCSGRTPKSPGAYDRRAEPFDDALAALWAAGDATSLAGLDGGLAGELGVSGWAAWQVAATAVLAAPGGGAALDAQLLAYEAPYGVGYFVATWLPKELPKELAKELAG